MRRNHPDSGYRADAARQRFPFYSRKKGENKQTLIGGICCGLALFTGCILQQFGCMYTTAGKAAFITTLYVVVVPLFSLLLGKRIRPIMWLCVVLGVIGLYLLAMPGGFGSVSKGDFYVILCAVAFAVHILLCDHFASKSDGVKISFIQFLTAGLLGCIGMFLFETPEWDMILTCAVPIYMQAAFPAASATPCRSSHSVMRSRL